MTMLVLTTLIATVALAWANGANDVSKGIATLVGSGRASYARGLHWGTLWTAAGSLASLFVAAGLVRTFSTALVTPSVSGALEFAAAVSGAAFVWVLLASATGMPVSTTHALTGAIIGTGLAVGGVGGVRWGALGTAVILPLASSPLLAAALSRIAHAALRTPLQRASRMCVCVARGGIGLQPLAGGNAAATLLLPVVTADRAEVCASYPGARLVIADGLHWGTAGLLSFARGLNDTPKVLALAAISLGALKMSGASLFVLGTIAMAAGCLAGRRVTRTLAERVTRIDPIEGLAASGVSAALVLLASAMALPVSTTHVATGAIVGAGLSGGAGAVRWREVGHIAIAWLVTLPVSAAVAAGLVHVL